MTDELIEIVQDATNTLAISSWQILVPPQRETGTGHSLSMNLLTYFMWAFLRVKCKLS